MPCCGGGSNGPCACRSGTRDVEGDSAVGLRMSGPNDPTPEQISLKGECAPESAAAALHEEHALAVEQTIARVLLFQNAFSM